MKGQITHVIEIYFKFLDGQDVLINIGDSAIYTFSGRINNDCF